MSRRTHSRTARIALALLAPALLAGCISRWDHFGRAPSFSPVVQPRAAIDPSLPATPRVYPVQAPGIGVRGATSRYAGYGPVPAHAYTDPNAYGGPAAPGAHPHAHPHAKGMPVPRTPHPGPAHGYGRHISTASLWSNSPQSLFGDRRAKNIGDILTVLVEIDDSATLNNSTSTSRSGNDSVAAATVYGLEQLVDRIIPGDAVSLENGVSASGSQDATGTGAITRDEAISLRVAATVVDVLPNGHLVVTGSQEVRVNFELRDLQVAGVIRPEDITRNNTITYDKIANARVSYGGRGHVSDMQQRRLGQQFVDMVSPF